MALARLAAVFEVPQPAPQPAPRPALRPARAATSEVPRPRAATSEPRPTAPLSPLLRLHVDALSSAGYGLMCEHALNELPAHLSPEDRDRRAILRAAVQRDDTSGLVWSRPQQFFRDTPEAVIDHIDTASFPMWSRLSGELLYREVCANAEAERQADEDENADDPVFHNLDDEDDYYVQIASRHVRFCVLTGDWAALYDNGEDNDVFLSTEDAWSVEDGTSLLEPPPTPQRIALKCAEPACTSLGVTGSSAVARWRSAREQAVALAAEPDAMAVLCFAGDRREKVVRDRVTGILPPDAAVREALRVRAFRFERLLYYMRFWRRAAQLEPSIREKPPLLLTARGAPLCAAVRGDRYDLVLPDDADPVHAPGAGIETYVPEGPERLRARVRWRQTLVAVRRILDRGDTPELRAHLAFAAHLRRLRRGLFRDELAGTTIDILVDASYCKDTIWVAAQHAARTGTPLRVSLPSDMLVDPASVVRAEIDYCARNLRGYRWDKEQLFRFHRLHFRAPARRAARAAEK